MLAIHVYFVKFSAYLLVAVPLKDQPSLNTVPLGSPPKNSQTSTPLGSSPKNGQSPINDALLGNSPDDRHIAHQPDNVSDLEQSQNRSSTESSNSAKSGELEIPKSGELEIPKSGELEIPKSGEIKTATCSVPSPLETVPVLKDGRAPAPPPAPCLGTAYPAPQLDKTVYDPVYEPGIYSLEAPFDPAPFVPWTDVGEELKTISESYTENKSVEDNYVKLGDISALCDSLHIHPKELPRRLASILNSIRSISSDTDQINQRLDSQHLISEELYMQMGVEKKMATPSSPSARLQEAMKTAKILQKAINEGAQQLAGENAVKLAADANIMVTIEVKEKVSQQEDRDPVFRLVKM